MKNIKYKIWKWTYLLQMHKYLPIILEKQLNIQRMGHVYKLFLFRKLIFEVFISDYEVWNKV